jgi:hypothetical protein
MTGQRRGERLNEKERENDGPTTYQHESNRDIGRWSPAGHKRKHSVMAHRLILMM